MGDVAMSVPVLGRLLQQYPEVRLSVVTKSFFAPIFNQLPRTQVIAAKVKEEHKGILGLRRLAKQLKELKPYAVADLHQVLRTQIIGFFLKTYGIKVARIDKGRAEKKKLTQHREKQIKPLKTTHQRYADVFADLGFPIDLNTDLPVIKPSLSAAAQEYFSESDRKVIGVAPFAAHEAKMYPIHLMRELLLKVAKTNRFSLLLFGGGKKEIEQLDQWEKEIPNTINLAGKHAFTEELAIIAHLDAMLAMDSGNGHLAAIYQVPVITLWGATHPFAGFAPFKQTEQLQFTPSLKKYPLLPTSIYGNKILPGYEQVMHGIDQNELIKTLQQVVKLN
jgi:ADP-heptose:LPS heptosyltransferase